MADAETEDYGEIEVRDDVPREDRAKFRAVFLYLVNKLKDRPEVGETSLHNLLYFIDFDHYELHEEQLMGLRYMHNDHGPTARMFKKWTDELAADGLIDVEKPGKKYEPETRYLPGGDARPSLSEREIEHIDAVVERLEAKAGGLGRGQLEAWLHKDVPWRSVGMKEDLEYEDVFYRTDETSVREYDEEDD